MNNNSTTSGGASFASLLTITFVVLKLCGVIHWPWLWVVSPLWITVLLAAAIFVVVMAFILAAAILSIFISDK